MKALCSLHRSCASSPARHPLASPTSFAGAQLLNTGALPAPCSCSSFVRPLTAPQRCRAASCSASVSGDASAGSPASPHTAALAVPRQATATSTEAASAASAAAAAPLRFRAGLARLTPLQRAAAAAHEALAAPRAASRYEAPSEQEAPEGDDDAEEREAAERRRRFVGQLQDVPHVVGAAEHLASARKRASKVTPSAGIKNAAEKERNRAARSLDALMQALSVPLRRYVEAFPDPARLHPFERALLGLTVGEAAYVAALQRVDRLRRAVQEVGKSAASRAANAANKAAATAALEEGCAAIETVFSGGARHVDSLKEVAKSLRNLPSLDSALPTLALVGAPNVGKSSLVQLLSSGTPEICNYPFTTRSIKMGHFYLDAQKHQVTDTPGLLRRPDSERNRMEALTLAALGCLDSAVLFVADLTEECGTSVADQWAIRSELRSRFPDKPWIDVLSKADMLQDVFAEADALVHSRASAAASAAAAAPVPAPGAGAQGEAQSEAAATAAAAEGEVASAVEMAAALPAALRISSLTQEGIPQLQLAIIRTLRAQAEARRAAQAAAAAAAAAAAQARPPAAATVPQQVAGARGKPPVLTFF